MISTELSTIFSILALALAAAASIIATAAALFARRAAQNSGLCASWMDRNNANAVSLKRMADVEAQMTDLVDSYGSLLASHKKLRARIGMRENRLKKGNTGDGEAEELHSETDKAALRLKAKQAGLLR